ncbi:MAG: SDR family oxidoreductase [Pseudomonadota bacterium]
MTKQQRVILVTGGSSGIGAAISQTFAALGEQVIVAQRRKAEVEGVEVINADLSQADDCTQLINTVVDTYGGLDVLVNNAGLMRENAVTDTSLEEWHATLNLNLTAPFVLSKAAFPHLGKRQGSIVNISSIESLASNPLHAAYCASKAGLNGLTQALAVDGGPLGIRCNAIAPGWIDTPLNDAFIESQKDPNQFRAGLADIHPAGRTGTPQDVAELAVWLASDKAEFVTGQIWTIDGGRTSKLSLP